MRRFLIWTALFAVVGVALAAGGYWAYWSMYARFQPVTVTEGADDIQRLLDAAPYLSAERGGNPIWIVGYRDDPAFVAYVGGEAERLRQAGIEPRVIVFARPDEDGVARSTQAERATVAELWLNRDWGLFQRWLAADPQGWTAAELPSADAGLTRRAIVEGGHDLSRDLAALLRREGVPTRWPLVIWRDPQGFLKACACAERRAWPFVRDDLDASEPPARREAAEPRMIPATPQAETGVAPPPVAADGGPGTQPYPRLEEILPVPQPRYADPTDTPPETAPTLPAPTPSVRPVPVAPPRATPPPRQAEGRRPPQARRDEETTFF